MSRVSHFKWYFPQWNFLINFLPLAHALVQLFNAAEGSLAEEAHLQQELY